MAASAITIANCHGGYRIDRGRLARIVSRTLRHIGRGRGIGFTFVFLDDRAIARMNRRFTGRARPTDVLSFLFDGGPAGGKRRIAEIYISIDRAAVQSKRFGAKLPDELIRYVVHGILHLFGYDDLTRAGRARMSRKEDRILQWLTRNGGLSKVLTLR